MPSDQSLDSGYYSDKINHLHNRNTVVPTLNHPVKLNSISSVSLGSPMYTKASSISESSISQLWSAPTKSKNLAVLNIVEYNILLLEQTDCDTKEGI